MKSIKRDKWHQRKRQQTILVPLKNDWETMILQGAAVRDVQKQGIKSISKGSLFRRVNKIKDKK